MTRESVLRGSDGKTIDLPLQEAEQDDISLFAKRVVLVGSSGQIIKSIRSRENLSGSSGTGSDGQVNRVYTLTTTNTVDIVEVFLDGVLLVETSNYTIDNSNKQVTILNEVWDSQTVTIFYNQ
jgi:flagellar basal body L-ring protein FlgH